MPLFVLAAATGFACMNPAHPSGETIRCAGRATRMQLHDIVIPEPASPCSGFADCPADSGSVARDHLAELTRGRKVMCASTGGSTRLDNPPRPIVRCTVASVDLSCLMVADGFAIGNDSTLACAAEIKAHRAVQSVPGRHVLAIPPAFWRWAPIYLIVANIFAYLLFAADKRREVDEKKRISEYELLLAVALGGGGGAVAAQLRLDHMRDHQPFASQAAILMGLQIGAVFAIGAMVFLKL